MVRTSTPISFSGNSLGLNTDQSIACPGKVTIGLVTSLTGSHGTQRADATYVLQTNDGANIVLTERAIIPYVEILFETGSSKYGWLNNVTAWATGTESDGLLSLNFWKVCLTGSIPHPSQLLISKKVSA